MPLSGQQTQQALQVWRGGSGCGRPASATASTWRPVHCNSRGGSHAQAYDEMDAEPEWHLLSIQLHTGCAQRHRRRCISERTRCPLGVRRHLHCKCTLYLQQSCRNRGRRLYTEVAHFALKATRGADQVAAAALQCACPTQTRLCPANWDWDRLSASGGGNERYIVSRVPRLLHSSASAAAAPCIHALAVLSAPHSAAPLLVSGHSSFCSMRQSRLWLGQSSFCG